MILLWLAVFVQSIPSVIDGSIFNAPCIPDKDSMAGAAKNLPFDQEKAMGSNPSSYESTVVL